ncbi:hypothetical protein C8Q76DRAFT_483160 [Earliella scabrosa]|nr:hypothetical protein C8Q76DRAFT_483160 [Earliella scabrosa]
MLAKTLAKQRYRLSDWDLEGLPVTHDSTVVNGFVRPMFLYSEQDLERKAWELHGGPAGLVAYFDKLLQRHQNRDTANKKPFVCPKAYDSRFSWRAGMSETEILERLLIGDSYILLDIRDTMVPWLWKACNDCFHPLSEGALKEKDREHIMLEARKFAASYPARPAAPLPSSLAVDNLRDLLAKAPSLKGIQRGNPAPGLYYFDGGFNGDPDWYEWEDAYLAQVYSALNAVLKAHGMGVDGWESVRWEVYDQYKDCTRRGICYYGSQGWQDDAKHWLKQEDLSKGIARWCSPSKVASQ